MPLHIGTLTDQGGTTAYRKEVCAHSLVTLASARPTNQVGTTTVLREFAYLSYTEDVEGTRTTSVTAGNA